MKLKMLMEKIRRTFPFLREGFFLFFLILLVLIPLILFINFFAGDFIGNLIYKEEQVPKQNEVNQSDMIIKELVNKYQATTDWEENLTYTLQAQERLITGKPILFRGYLDDIFSRDGKVFIRINSSLYFHSFLTNYYILELECHQQAVDKILAYSNEFYPEFAVVATVQEVTKPLFALKGEGSYVDDIEINIESSDLFIIKGACVDIAYIDSDKIF